LSAIVRTPVKDERRKPASAHARMLQLRRRLELGTTASG
jgi:hypothetical protein